MKNEKPDKKLLIEIEESCCPCCPFYNGDYCNINRRLVFSYTKQIVLHGECPLKDGITIKVNH